MRSQGVRRLIVLATVLLWVGGLVVSTGCSKRSSRTIRLGADCISITPSSGPTSGGTIVTITGRDFDAGAVVFFGASEAIAVVVDQNGKGITCESPPGAPGPVDVIVWNPDGRGCRFADGFIYAGSPPCPSPSTVDPAEGPVSGGTPVTLTGSNFIPPLSVRFGASDARNIVVLSATQLECLTPPGSGIVDVIVENASCSMTLPQAFLYYPAPAVGCTSDFTVSPRCVAEAGGDTVQILCDSGATFDPTTAVLLDGVAVYRTLVSPCEMTLVTPPLAQGNHSIEVHARWGSWLFGGALVVPECPSGGMAICGITPASGYRTGGDTITIVGCGFPPGVTTVRFDSILAPLVTWFDKYTLQVTTPPFGCPEVVDVTVSTQTPGQEVTLRRGFEFLPVPADPHLSALAPASGPFAGGQAVTLTGTGFAPGSIVHFESQIAQVLAVGPTQIDCLTPPGAAAGLVDVGVEDPSTGCRTVLECAYEYTP